ncbi:hypothetical protein GDO81_006952 [Engystomops pustulosus]|uniref:Uncharacterized protein n=1 Tax=Engystomops pustulosus TaxID=76066 RepID=A0AAV7D1R7_ENGPU|nr:hypothetical protein GDO81_006952 [Engystomops pustulosus]
MGPWLPHSLNTFSLGFDLFPFISHFIIRHSIQRGTFIIHMMVPLPHLAGSGDVQGTFTPGQTYLLHKPHLEICLTLPSPNV